MSGVEPAAAGADHGEKKVAPQEDGGVGTGGGEGTGGGGNAEAQLAVVSVDEVAERREYGDEGYLHFDLEFNSLVFT
ncbi:hypothetical protein EJB05_21359, partial [Eragrostis curvula]